ncbi:hypothetical protein IE53DRAFT_386328 [Violaceomyces palustris]|uniref:Uncharacterized protein n=1 Tax=Violaceomyces palustris TaxID=1673888 RepID=A0ACD0P028_9BASI|nr:hypothetical protein IE53DRAFT_386328 [Violaceomyces palustris]
MLRKAAATTMLSTSRSLVRPSAFTRSAALVPASTTVVKPSLPFLPSSSFRLPSKKSSSPFFVSSPVRHQPLALSQRFSTTSLALEKQQEQRNQEKGSSSKKEREEEVEEDDGAPPKGSSIRDRLRFLTRRYGWWALGVYMLASLFDFTLIFVSIHMLGADHIRDLEVQVRKAIGLTQRDQDEDDQQQQVAQVDTGDGQAPPRQAVRKSSSSSTSIWTEAVLAYTIHKTLLLPFRVAITAAVTPSFVKWLVKMGWAKPHSVVRKAAEQAAKRS